MCRGSWLREGRRKWMPETMQPWEAEREALLSDSFLACNSHESQLGSWALCSEKSHILPISIFKFFFAWDTLHGFLFLEVKRLLINQNIIWALFHMFLTGKPSESETMSHDCSSPGPWTGPYTGTPGEFGRDLRGYHVQRNQGKVEGPHSKWVQP